MEKHLMPQIKEGKCCEKCYDEKLAMLTNKICSDSSCPCHKAPEKCECHVSGKEKRDCDPECDCNCHQAPEGKEKEVWEEVFDRAFSWLKCCESHSALFRAEIEEEPGGKEGYWTLCKPEYVKAFISKAVAQTKEEERERIRGLAQCVIKTKFFGKQASRDLLSALNTKEE